MSSNNHFVNKDRVERYNYYASDYNGVRNVKEHDDYDNKEFYRNERRGCGRIITFVIFVIFILTVLFILTNKNTV
jgi:hypothetical protein